MTDDISKVISLIQIKHPNHYRLWMQEADSEYMRLLADGDTKERYWTYCNNFIVERFQQQLPSVVPPAVCRGNMQLWEDEEE